MLLSLSLVKYIGHVSLFLTQVISWRWMAMCRRGRLWVAMVVLLNCQVGNLNHPLNTYLPEDYPYSCLSHTTASKPINSSSIYMSSHPCAQHYHEGYCIHYVCSIFERVFYLQSYLMVKKGELYRWTRCLLIPSSLGAAQSTSVLTNADYKACRLIDSAWGSNCVSMDKYHLSSAPMPELQWLGW